MRLRKAGLSGFPVISYSQNQSTSPTVHFSAIVSPCRNVIYYGVPVIHQIVALRLFLDGTYREAVGAIIVIQWANIQRKEV